jgi:hypothetical protein
VPEAQALILFYAASYELHSALRPVNGNISEDQHILAVLQLKVQGETVVLKENAGDRRALVLESEISVSRPVMKVVGDLASCPEVMQAGIVLQAVCYPLIQVGDCEYLGQDNGILVRPDI